MRLAQLLASAPLVVLASVGLAPTSSAQDYVGSAPGAGSDEAGLPPESGPGGGGDYVGLPPDSGPGGGGDYVGLPPGPGGGGDYVGADLVGVAAPLPPSVPELARGVPADDGRPVARIGSYEDGRPARELPVSPSDVVVLGGLATAGLALAARRSRGAR
ncbi:MAG: hypothetical protein M3N25_08315 [Actinomycetota bacterium]|nr:hypothetical protein [Actinomycetota bacterium]